MPELNSWKHNEKVQDHKVLKSSKIMNVKKALILANVRITPAKQKFDTSVTVQHI